MTRGTARWMLRAGVLAGVWVVAQCRDEPTQQTELLLTLTADISVSEVEIRARNISYQDDIISKAMGSRSIVTDPLLLLITPSRIIKDRFLIHAKGFVNGTLAVAAAEVYEFVPNQRIEATLTMSSYFAERDSDGDGFEACNEIGCDCNDSNAVVNPFTEESCTDRVDNNCSGLPINEGCPCRLDCIREPGQAERPARSGEERNAAFVAGDPPAWCTVLTGNLVSLAGIGKCSLGTLNCRDDGNGDCFGVLDTACDDAETFTTEIEGNDVDDDCDGTVDEGSPCVEVETPSRACFLGHVNTEHEPNKLNKLEHARPVGVCSLGTQYCTSGQWGPCTGEILPQRNTETGFGWIELPPDSNAGFAGQCDGLDNDCDGDCDEEPYFDGDADGYTPCGTDPDGCGQYNEFIDCNDDPTTGGASIHPGATEICGNGIDEDCRCDHDSQDRPADDCASSEIGCPVSVFDTTDDPPFYGLVDKLRSCNDAHGHLDCRLGTRSDANPSGVCLDTPTPYYHGYFGPTDTDKDCYYCLEQYGVVCSSDTDACETKHEACCSCDADDPPLSARAVERPPCGSPNPSGCTCDESGPVPPVWDDIIGSDPNDECGEVSCRGHYHGLDGGRCYEKRDQAAVDVDCKAGNTCEAAADLCPGETERNPTPDTSQPPCTIAVGGCTGVTPPEWQNQAAGDDQFGDCTSGFTCSTTEPGNGGGPFYFGIFDDANGNPQCYLHEDVDAASHNCDGAGACQTRGPACLASGQGSVAPGRQLCMRPTGGCTGTTAPIYGPVDRYQDPYNDCPGSETCDGDGHCHRQQGDYCGDGRLCEGDNCIDDYCCNDSCTGPCRSCAAAQTGGSNGQCSNIITGTDPDSECSGGLACNSGSCATSCMPSCGIDPDNCEAGYFCNSSNSCAQLINNGTPPDTTCDAASCSSGVVADGYCCNNACQDTCRSCNGAETIGSNGQCSDITAGTDPDGECTGGLACNGGGCATSCSPVCSSDTSNCEAGYYCDNSSSCTQLLSNGTLADVVCLEDSCSSGNAADGYCCNNPCLGTCRSCDGAETTGPNGQCSDITAGTDPDGECSGGWACNSGSCATSCSPACGSDTSNCEAGNYCDNSSSCAQLRSNGTLADVDCLGASCSSGNAADGYCCNNACLGTCRSCDGAETTGPNGQCSDITAGTDPDGECSGGWACNSGSCATSCSPACGSDTSNCETGSYCDSGDNCVWLLANGTEPEAPCGASSCLSGFAADGFCCNSDCTNTCLSCDSADTGGIDGTCSFIESGSTDPNASTVCVDGNDCTPSDCACNGSGVCLGVDDATGCGGDGSLCVSGVCSANTCGL